MFPTGIVELGRFGSFSGTIFVTQYVPVVFLHEKFLREQLVLFQEPFLDKGLTDFLFLYGNVEHIVCEFVLQIDFCTYEMWELLR